MVHRTSILSEIILLSLFFLTCQHRTPLQNNETTRQINSIAASASLSSRPFDFQFANKKYSGLLDLPKDQEASSLMILVPGHGKTNVASGKWNIELRTTLNEMGIAIYAYDKAGCGNSEGTYDHNQTVEDSSEEILAAIQQLKKKKVPGSNTIGLWGISRAGWIIPLVIKKDQSIAYWISVSGPNHLSNMKYLLTTNWRIQGKSETEIETLVTEWKNGFDIQRTGGSYDEYVSATPNLSNDDFIQVVRGGAYTEERFLNYQQYLLEHQPEIDPESGIEVIVSDFEAVLNHVDCPVLAIFGEKDSQVDCQETSSLYNKVFKENLTVAVLPNCNHHMQVCETGGFTENANELKKKGLGQACEDYFEVIADWISERVLD
ncbi:alpha/beta hydrolase family protein [Flavilitoribacter nigricans]|uniref:Alpha/beta hydrolase n=1 Tax=Flavilitoribacter nigricans (strain ATCC 23147 / DSM 23189 / NBRC 102662 / NCIMB 1420 / SS-2) TaxID=1122177 RepID=A0A2D0MYP5_FLAN2|nr:alpha/beta hydrolase [Flavilitoribacter nigricans]PHN01394.1 alpha/beta hydrolase [Flavilitoribacter nigricans DSM 23189 = NBRC 102662]